MRKKFLAVVLIGSMILSGGLFTGCGKKSDSSKDKASESSASEVVEGGDYIVGAATEISNYNPYEAETADARGLLFNIYEGLVKVTSDGSFVPAVAESYTKSDDSTVYTFTLRSGVKFHDGSDVKSSDVLYSIKKAQDAKAAGYDEIKSVEATDDKTIVFTLNAPDTAFEAYLTQAIIPENASDLATNPIGTGPFKFEEYAEQDHVKLVRFDDYWGEKAHLDSVTVKFAADQATLFTYFQGGSTSACGSMGNDAINQLNETDYNTFDELSNSVQFLGLNNSVKPFDDVRVRQAIAYLVDSDEIIQTVCQGVAHKAGGPVIPNLTKYYNSDIENTYDVNVEKAKELLKEAGYENGFEFTIRVPSSYTVHVDTAQLIVNQLKKANVTAKIELVDWPTWLEKVYTNRDYEATIISVDAAVAYPTAFLSRYVSTADNNFVNFKSDKFDEAYKKAVAATDEEEKVKAFKECQQILSDECSSVYIEDIGTRWFQNKDFAGHNPLPIYATDFSAVHKTK